jgi:hypothetical protein
MMVSPSLFAFVKKIEVNFNTQIPTHAALTLSLGHPKQEPEQDVNQAPKSLCQRLDEKIEEDNPGKTEKEKEKAKKLIHEKIKHEMDAQFLDHDAQLQQAYRHKDVNGAWALWSDIVENAFIDCVVGEKWWASERERKK